MESSNSNASIITELVTSVAATSPSQPVSLLEEDAATIETKLERNVHIPYILNGQLYEIQTQEGENVTVKCVHCPPDRVYRGSVRSTGNFHMHIKRRHPDLLGKLHDMKVNALLERRDRYMKNRKLPHRTSSAKNGTHIKQELPLPFAQVKEPELGLIHTHKLKIKRAFQKHQQQKAMRKWNVTPFVVVPLAKSVEAYEPINYSLKENYEAKSINESQQPILATNEQTNEIQIVDALMPMESDINPRSAEIYNDLNSQNSPASSQSFVYPSNFEPQELQTQQQQTQSAIYDNIIAITPYSSTVASSGSNLSLDSDTMQQHNTIALVKNENLMAPEQPMDLSVQNSNLSAISSGIGSAETLTSGSNSFSSTITAASNTAASANNFKWNELLVQVETSLQDIQREMSTRNHIETNRLFLDIAKFKYLHPGFNFQY